MGRENCGPKMRRRQVEEIKGEGGTRRRKAGDAAEPRQGDFRGRKHRDHRPTRKGDGVIGRRDADGQPRRRAPPKPHDIEQNGRRFIHRLGCLAQLTKVKDPLGPRRRAASAGGGPSRKAGPLIKSATISGPRRRCLIILNPRRGNLK